MVAVPAVGPEKFRRNMLRFPRHFHFPCKQKISTDRRL